MTDDEHQTLVAIFNLLGSLAKKLTGEVPLVCMEDKDHNINHTYAALSHVHWGKEVPKECPLHDRHGRPPIEPPAQSPP